ncbi:hypothetical protein [Priestia megaterium]|uniref:hypothetical protein n=1 Tax=Priestia megaterium TaxID=1404 RepID=UPI0012B6DD2F|nr:hypothetical protein [Priestia megaterium]
MENEFIGVVGFEDWVKNNEEFIGEIRELFGMGGRIAGGGGFLIGYGYFYRIGCVTGRVEKS